MNFTDREGFVKGNEFLIKLTTEQASSFGFYVRQVTQK